MVSCIVHVLMTWSASTISATFCRGIVMVPHVFGGFLEFQVVLLLFFTVDDDGLFYCFARLSERDLKRK